MREPILIKFGTQQKITTSMTVSRDQILKFLKFKMAENVANAITRLPMYRYGRNVGGHIPSCLRHVRHDEVAMATAVE